MKPALRDRLLHLRSEENLAARVVRDPIQFPKRYKDPLAQEWVGLLASSLAFGNVTTILAKVETLIAPLGDAPHRSSSKDLWKRWKSFRHRVWTGEEIVPLMIAASELQREHGSLGRLFSRFYKQSEGDAMTDPTVVEASILFVDALRSRITGGELGRAASHLLPSPADGSACKRLFLYLRWMVRPRDGIDLGLWDVPTSALLCPIDVHVFRIASNLGWTTRKTVDLETAKEITAALRLVDEKDPVSLDFALCHFGMVSDCKSTRDHEICGACSMKPHCTVWTPGKRWTPAKKAAGRLGKKSFPVV